MNSKLSFVVIGCGSRARAYMKIARDLGHGIAAYADPRPEAREVMRRIAAGQGNDAEGFGSAEELLAAAPAGDVALIATQDARHDRDATGALEAGYDLLLEKPAAQTAGEVEGLARLAAARNRRIVLCFVLRYTPFYRGLKAVVDAGRVGRVMSIQASEGVGPWHHAHSFVRGHWSRSGLSTPMMVAKCCHDTDILSWLADAPCRRVSSFAKTSHFLPEMAPPGATRRCTDGCPHLGRCRFDAHRYLDDQRRWLEMVRADADGWDSEAIRKWLRASDWGRCAYFCDQDTPDHQVVAMEFDNGITADFTMTAFDSGRRIRVYGDEGTLVGALHADGREPWLEYRPHEGEAEAIDIGDLGPGGYSGHGGGDFGLIEALPELLTKGRESDGFLDGHRIAFAAAESAARGVTVAL